MKSVLLLMLLFSANSFAAVGDDLFKGGVKVIKTILSQINPKSVSVDMEAEFRSAMTLLGENFENAILGLNNNRMPSTESEWKALINSLPNDIRVEFNELLLKSGKDVDVEDIANLNNRLTNYYVDELDAKKMGPNFKRHFYGCPGCFSEVLKGYGVKYILKKPSSSSSSIMTATVPDKPLVKAIEILKVVGKANKSSYFVPKALPEGFDEAFVWKISKLVQRIKSNGPGTTASEIELLEAIEKVSKSSSDGSIQLFGVGTEPNYLTRLLADAEDDATRADWVRTLGQVNELKKEHGSVNKSVKAWFEAAVQRDPSLKPYYDELDRMGCFWK